MKTLFLLTALLCSTAQASRANIQNFSKVTDGIYRGARPTDGNIGFLSESGIKTIVNLQGGDLNNFGLGGIIGWYEPGELPAAINHERATSEALNIRFYNFPLNALAPVNAAEDEEIDQILSIMENPEMLPVFIHCEHGKDRTGLLIALYRVKVQKWTSHDAFTEWFNSGHTNISSMYTGGLDYYFFQKIKRY